MEDIRSGDILFTTLRQFSNYLTIFLSGSQTNHMAIAVWISAKGIRKRELDIVARQEPGASLCLLEMSRRKTKDFRFREPRNNVVMTTFEDCRRRINRAFYRPIDRNIPDQEIIEKLKDFIQAEEKCEFSIGALQAINMLFNLKAGEYEGETCVSFSLKWLESIGHQPDFEKRSRQLYLPDHLMKNHEDSKVFADGEKEFFSVQKPLSDFFFCLVVIVLVFLFLSVFINLSMPIKSLNSVL